MHSWYGWKHVRKGKPMTGETPSVNNGALTRQKIQPVWPVEAAVQPSVQPSIQPSIQPSVQPSVQAVEAIKASVKAAVQPPVDTSAEPKPHQDSQARKRWKPPLLQWQHNAIRQQTLAKWKWDRWDPSSLPMMNTYTVGVCASKLTSRYYMMGTWSP